MSAFQIKILAILAMIIDHIGLFFFPQYYLLRIIGRLSFPLFAWLIANGVKHTKNGLLYLQRLFILACVSQIPFTIANHKIGNSYWFFNVVFTLCLGLTVALAFERSPNWRWRAIFTALALVIAYIGNTDYGVAGVLSVICFYLFFEKPWKMVVSQIIVYSAPVLWFVGTHVFYHKLAYVSVYNFNELVALVSLVPIYRYTKKEGFKAKYLFYIFYPLQYLIILMFQLKLYAN